MAEKVTTRREERSREVISNDLRLQSCIEVCVALLTDL